VILPVAAGRLSVWRPASAGPSRVLAAGMLAVLCACPPASVAQVHVSLADLTMRALANNAEVAIQREAVQMAHRAGDRAQAAFDPVVRLETRGRVRTDPLNTIFSGAPEGALAPRGTTVGGSASVVRLFSTGATATAATSISRETTNSVLGPLSPAWLTSTAAELRQPLLQGRNFDAARRAVSVAAVDRARSIVAHERTVSETVAAVERAYWALVAGRREAEVRRQAVALAEAQRVDTHARIDAGMAAETDIAQPAAEMQRRLGELLVAEENAARAEHALKALVLPGSDDPWWDETLVPADSPETPTASLSLAAMLAHALERRAEVREAREGIARQQVEIAYARDRLRPALDLVATYAMRGFAGELNAGLSPPFPFPVPPPPDDQLGAMFRSWATGFEQRFVDASVGVQLSLPLGHRAAHADAATAEAARRQAELLLVQVRQRVVAEVRTAHASLETARRRIEAARAGRDAARVQLQAEQDRFDAGATIGFFVLTRQNELAQAELAETAAIIDYRRALVELARASGTLLSERGIEIAPAAPPVESPRRSQR
jgi:outer membrane protein